MAIDARFIPISLYIYQKPAEVFCRRLSIQEQLKYFTNSTSGGSANNHWIFMNQEITGMSSVQSKYIKICMNNSLMTTDDNEMLCQQSIGYHGVSNYISICLFAITWWPFSSPDTVPPVQQLIKGGRKPFTMFNVISRVTEEQLPLMRITSCPA